MGEAMDANNKWVAQAQKEAAEKMKPIIKEKVDKAVGKTVNEKDLIDPNDYALVICLDGKSGRLFENGKDTTRYVMAIDLSYEAGDYPELTVMRKVRNKRRK